MSEVNIVLEVDALYKCKDLSVFDNGQIVKDKQLGHSNYKSASLLVYSLSVLVIYQ